jgi:hypothetical protein
MRARIHQEMAEVCRPYYKRLEQLDAVEEFLKSEQDALRAKSAKAQAWETRRANKKTKVRRIPPMPKLLPSGDSTGDYSGMNQSEAISIAVTNNPGINVQEITAELVGGGFPFKSRKPVDSMYVAVRTAEKMGLVQRAHGPNGKNIYNPPSKNSHPNKIKEPKFTRRSGLTDAVINVIANGPDEGMTRKEVLDALESSGFQFDNSSQSKPDRRVTWALQSLYVDRRIDRRGIGQLAIFSRPKVTAVKNK